MSFDNLKHIFSVRRAGSQILPPAFNGTKSTAGRPYDVETELSLWNGGQAN